MAKNANRRDLVTGSLVFVVAACTQSGATAQLCARSSVTDGGPFHPPGDIPERWNLIADGAEPAGQRLYLTGVVRGPDCAPLSDATVIVWQADSNGRYDHPNAENNGPLDPGFRYFGRQQSQSNGEYRLNTIVPAPYQFRGLHRAPHIHFAFTHPRLGGLVTELYFDRPDDAARRAGDRVWATRDPATRDAMIMALHTQAASSNAPLGSVWCHYDVTVPS